MAWIRAALASTILLALGAPMAAQEEDGPVPPVYVPEEQQNNTPADPPVVCQGQNCLPPEENPVQQCEGQNCTPSPLEGSE
jgi:hypothetical protein